ncbi:MAG: aminotransferase [Rhizobiaceae bacterium]|nr:aminotransferase [Rhizobiaceae bacterium]
MSRSLPAAEASPLDLLHGEMRRQSADALASLDAAREGARAVAAHVRSTGRLLMLGMGASHWANRMALANYRALGVDARAEVLSEQIRMPAARRDHAVLLTSQSGGSGEIRVWLERQGDLAGVFGLTLQADSLLGRAVPCLVGQGGRERAFAATRSVTLTLALHAAVLEALGMDVAALRDVWASTPGLPPPAPEPAVHALASCRTLVLASRGELVPVLECAALTYMELSRTPALALELGQLIHGPQEAMGPDTALVLARPDGPDAAGVTRFARATVSWGVPVVLFDMGGRHQAIEETTAIALPALTGLPAVARLLPAVQALAIVAAARRVPDMGVPRRSSKVTDGEAA